MKAVIAGGGTAGHVNPALALAAAFDGDVSFIGTADGAEARLVPSQGFELDVIDVRGFDRSKPLGLPAVGARAVTATTAARKILKQRRPDVVVGMGGYVSLPAGLAARSLGLPLVLHEQNIVLGLANKVLRRRAAAVAVSFDETLAEAGPHGVMTGNPVAARLIGFDRVEARRRAADEFGLDPARPTMLVFGGSLGARTVNEAALGLQTEWMDRSDRQVLHISGSAQPVLDAQPSGLIFRSVPFVADMTLAYGAADLALCRGGASTVAEITVAGVPSIVVPYPYHRDRQQERHAKVLERAGAAVLLPDAGTTAALVAELADALYEEPERLEAMRSAALGLAHPDAADRLAGVIRQVAG